jgi:hypothetical protein
VVGIDRLGVDIGLVVLVGMLDHRILHRRSPLDRGDIPPVDLAGPDLDRTGLVESQADRDTVVSVEDEPCSIQVQPAYTNSETTKERPEYRQNFIYRASLRQSCLFSPCTAPPLPTKTGVSIVSVVQV